MLQRPDRLQAGGAPSNGSGPPLDLTAGYHGDVHWDNDTYTMSYLGKIGIQYRLMQGQPPTTRVFHHLPLLLRCFDGTKLNVMLLLN